MKKKRGIKDARHWFAEDIRIAAPVRNTPAIITAFAKIPREHYLGAGPWRIHPRRFDRPAYISATADPHQIYHDVLVSIDHDLEINNGLPSLWAYYLDQMDIRPGATVLQVGAGVGYFTAILAELVTSSGRVIAYEIDQSLAARAKDNLAGYGHVEVLSGDATKAESLPDLDAVIVFAGATHIPENWLSNLAGSGRIVIPFTADDHWGFMLLLSMRGAEMHVSSLGNCGFYHCGGARQPDEAAALKSALEATGGKVPPLGQMYQGRPAEGDLSVWYVGDGFWLSKA
ncbi:MAG: methyltransferase domain-containing protein [Marinosulfonomonas sp.]|nr:methyltransferase domain-containing protein [Marinosulfonomonas sp.]